MCVAFNIEKINNINFSLSYNSNIKYDECAICINDINDNCMKCDNNINCYSILGTCGHVFHYHCISRWLYNDNRTRNNDKCPLCKTKFIFTKKNKYSL